MSAGHSCALRSCRGESIADSCAASSLAPFLPSPAPPHPLIAFAEPSPNCVCCSRSPTPSTHCCSRKRTSPRSHSRIIDARTLHPRRTLSLETLTKHVATQAWKQYGDVHKSVAEAALRQSARMRLCATRCAAPCALAAHSPSRTPLTDCLSLSHFDDAVASCATVVNLYLHRRSQASSGASEGGAGWKGGPPEDQAHRTRQSAQSESVAN